MNVWYSARYGAWKPPAIMIENVFSEIKITQYKFFSTKTCFKKIFIQKKCYLLETSSISSKQTMILFQYLQTLPANVTLFNPNFLKILTKISWGRISWIGANFILFSCDMLFNYWCLSPKAKWTQLRIKRYLLYTPTVIKC